MRGGRARRNFLTDGETGLLADDDAGLARGLVRLAEDPDLRSRLARPDPALRRFDWATVSATHLDCYAETMARAKSG